MSGGDGKEDPKFERVPCNLCGTNDYSVFLESPQRVKPEGSLFSATSYAVAGERLVRCRVCGLIYVNPRLPRQKILDQYRVGEEEMYVREAEARAASFARSLRIIQAYKKEGKLLDVGCAAGFFLKVAQEAGFEVYGVEPNLWLAEWGRKNLSLEVAPGPFEEVPFPPNFFEVVTFWDVLEHLADPFSALQKTNAILKEGGIVVINYPNIGSLSARIFGKNWWFIVSSHLYYFDRKTMRRMLNEAGFRVLEDRVHIQNFSLAYLLRQLKRYRQGVGEALYRLSLGLGLGNVKIPYWAGQRMVLASKV